MEMPTVRRVRARGLHARTSVPVGRVPSRGVRGCEISGLTSVGCSVNPKPESRRKSKVRTCSRPGVVFVKQVAGLFTGGNRENGVLSLFPLFPPVQEVAAPTHAYQSLLTLFSDCFPIGTSFCVNRAGTGRHFYHQVRAPQGQFDRGWRPTTRGRDSLPAVPCGQSRRCFVWPASRCAVWRWRRSGCR